MLFKAQAMHELASAYFIFAFTASVILGAVVTLVGHGWRRWRGGSSRRG